MTLAARLRAALDAPHDEAPVLLASDTRDLPDGDAVPMPAAVLVAVTDRPEPGLILTRRTDSMRRHAGQVAFPGGRIDPEDHGAIAAALREAQEEIGLDPAVVEVVGPADLYRTITGFEVQPVVAVIPPDLVFTPEPGEVAAVFEVPLGFVLDPANHIEATVEWQGRDRHYYEIGWSGHRIWGATAAMLVNLSRRLKWTAQ
ncbi:CoA pyrophosphatase [Sphingomonas sp. MG17]|uniref:CoA pyrophosphatase n=1 Tax=Sphingomonas tagetis TaxID=2949092 RepID=A0A9X2HJB3_9SPHN|nr:CoA pyrophosphatase [Sphingomonas tagetis]MCP3732271.1 CoA pyrophosphatase [Sphingomonas tagetis]